MIDLEELKRRRFKMHAEWTPVEQEASAEQFAMLEEFDRQFPAIVAKLEAAQRLRDDLMMIMAPTVSNMSEAANQAHMVAMAIAAFDKEQQ